MYNHQFSCISILLHQSYGAAYPFLETLDLHKNSPFPSWTKVKNSTTSTIHYRQLSPHFCGGSISLARNHWAPPRTSLFPLYTSIERHKKRAAKKLPSNSQLLSRALEVPKIICIIVIFIFEWLKTTLILTFPVTINLLFLLILRFS